MKLFSRTLLERTAQMAALILLTTLFVLTGQVVSSSVTLAVGDRWNSSEPRLHLTWKLNLHPLRELFESEDRP
jgi:hypothetical protein